MQCEQCRGTACQRFANGIQVFGALGQHQHIMPLLLSVGDHACDGRGTAAIIGDVVEQGLNAGISGMGDLLRQVTRNGFQNLRRLRWPGCRVSRGPTLHEDDGLAPVAVSPRTYLGSVALSAQA